MFKNLEIVLRRIEESSKDFGNLDVLIAGIGTTESRGQPYRETLRQTAGKLGETRET